MANARIMIVEDEVIIAHDLERDLQGLGYAVTAKINSAEAAIERAKIDKPDLILMDIVLKGPMDGIEAAEAIRSFIDVPVIYLTAYSDDSTLDRAKVTEPFGYLIKPIGDRELHTTIEMALCKHAMECALKESEERYELAVIAGRVGIWDWRVREDFLYIDPFLKTMLGYDDWTLPDSMSRWRGLLHPEDSLRYVEEWNVCLTGDQDYCEVEHRMMHKDGPVLWFMARGRIIRDESGRVTRVICSEADITAAKELEKQLRHLNRELEERVREETARRLQNEQILIQRSRMAAMGDMIGAIAHQWRQPLNAVGLIIQDLDDAFSNGEITKEYIQSTVAAAMEQIKFMNQTIQDFRNFLKPSKARVSFDLNTAVREVLSILRAQLTHQRITVTLQCSLGNSLYTGYPNELKQVILNIINNARDAIVQYKQSHKEAHYEGLISIAVLGDTHQASIEISDNGGGIAQQYLEKIFDAYFTTKDSSGGTGVGLYMSRVIIEKHMGGTLTAQNIPLGAKFTITLPRYFDLESQATEADRYAGGGQWY